MAAMRRSRPISTHFSPERFVLEITRTFHATQSGWLAGLMIRIEGMTGGAMASRNVNCVWFDKGEARKAASFYATSSPDTRVAPARAAPADFPSGNEGDELTVEFTVLGRPFLGLNGGPEFK